MEFSSKSESEFYKYMVEFLNERGYGRNSLLYEFPVKIGDQIFHPDFMIIDPIRNERLAIIDVINELQSKHYENLMSKRIQMYSQNLNATSNLILVVKPSNKADTKSPFEFFKIDPGGKLLEYAIETFPSFDALSSNKQVLVKDELEQKGSKTTDRFKILCIILAFVIIILIATDVYFDRIGYKLLTVERLTLFGISVALIILPYAAKLKFLGIEYERLLNRKKSNE